MSRFEKLFIPEADFINYTEAEKIQLITHQLGNIGLEATALLFCGIEGKDLLLGEPVPRHMTFAASYKKMVEAAREIDEIGSTNEGGYPLNYATNTEIEKPAIAAYDRKQLIPLHPEEDDDWDWLEEWVHVDSKSVDEALRAVVFFDK
ncbi:MAG TPA: hypothetical protein VLF39_04595 [Candidatus Saccharimonadales bacterium]|nr:hypothetical protein [Candidatus Saccharimonadales bacterium]